MHAHWTHCVIWVLWGFTHIRTEIQKLRINLGCMHGHALARLQMHALIYWDAVVGLWGDPCGWDCCTWISPFIMPGLMGNLLGVERMANTCLECPWC